MMGRPRRRAQIPADPGEPVLVNGDFEESNVSGDQPVGWYYVRQGKVEADGRTPAAANASRLRTTRRAGPHRHCKRSASTAARSRLDVKLFVRVRDARVQPQGPTATSGRC